MSQLKKLKAACSLHEVAELFGFKPKALAFILYGKKANPKYKQFEIPKRSGGTRTISAPYPDLMKLQRRVAKCLQDCISEINTERKVKSTLSHGFRRKRSIITNAVNHRNKRFVFNTDLENFFGTINFGRIRGFFLKNKNFELHEQVATILAQIASHENALPQGSSCSPVISNLVGHILDIRLAELASATGCGYSRYADDITFSTNKRIFPASVCTHSIAEPHKWVAGDKLKKIIVKAGFSINLSKTRMQYKGSRQEVTGLVVNSKVNVRDEYRRKVRVFVYTLLSKGKFHFIQKTTAPDGTISQVEVPGRLTQLNGMLSFIDSVSVYERTKNGKADKNVPTVLTAAEKIYRNFLFFQNFYSAELPTILCEGKTDNIYLRAAIVQLAKDYPILAAIGNDGKVKLRVKFLNYSKTTARILALDGGTGDMGNLLRSYANDCEKINAPGLKNPVILLIDNDAGARSVFNPLGGMSKPKIHIDGTQPYYFSVKNLYVVPTPFLVGTTPTMIEDFFLPAVKALKLGGKTFNTASKKGFDSATEYGKHLFAEQIVKKNQKTIDFNSFRAILDRVVLVINDYTKKVVAS
jgi:RNA-directed DNA polymerase